MAAPQNYVSVSRRPPDVEDYIDILRRYRSWVIGPTFAGLVISVVVAFYWPNMYLCTAAMQIKPSAVANTLMPSAMTGQMAQRLQQLELDIFSRDNLITLIKNPKLDLYEKERQRYSVEEVAEDTLRKHLHFQMFDAAGSTSGAQAFRIAFEYPDRNKARAVVVELMSEFVSQNVVLQNANTTSTSHLFEDLVQNAKEKMDKAQNDLANFASENQGRLPENFQANSMTVQTKEASISNVNQLIGQEKQHQTILESNLSNNKNMQSQAEANLTQTINTPNQQVKNESLINIEKAISERKAACAGLLRKYQPEYPDVLACNDTVRNLEEQRDGIQKTDSAPATGSTIRTVANTQVAQQLQQLQAEERSIMGQIHASVQQVSVLEHQLDQLNKELKEAQDKINASPQIIQKYNALMQDLNMAKDEYTSLSGKKEQAGTQQSMEEHRAGETLETLETPILPENPTSPIRGAIIGIGTVIGLVLGVALAGAKEVKNTSLKNLKDVRAYTNLPVLTSIPLLENALLVRRKRRLAWLAWSSALIVGSILMSGAVYYHYFIALQT